MFRTSDHRSLAAGVGLVVAGVLPGFLTASLAPRIRGDFAFGDSRLGVAVAAFYAMSAISSTPAGRLVERIGALRGMRIGVALTAVSCVAIAALADSATGLTALLLVAAIGNAMAGPAVSALLRQEVERHRQGLAFGAQQAGAPVGSLLAGLALPAVAIPLGWRWAYLATAVWAVLTAGLVRGVASGSGSSKRARPSRRLGSVHALALAAALASAAGVGFVAFLVLYAVEQGISETAAGLLLAGVSLVSAASRIGLGMLTDRRGGDPLRPVVGMLVASVPAYGLMIAGAPVLIAIAALLAGGLGWSWPGALTLAVVERRPDAPAWAVGVMMTGLFIGAVVGPLVVGLLAEHDLFAAGWIVCAAFALLAAVTVAAVRGADSRVAA